MLIVSSPNFLYFYFPIELTLLLCVCSNCEIYCCISTALPAILAYRIFIKIFPAIHAQKLCPIIKSDKYH